MISDNNGQTLYYGYTDNQGSLVALTDQNGNVVEKYAYDPWGARRNPTDWRLKDTRTGFITNRGYTGHEHLDMFNIINMNGRVYDPLTAMFFSPDPFIQAPDNWLNYNRYGYCMNNPTKYTDPSGYQWDVLDMPREDVAWVNHADPQSGASGISRDLYGVYGSFGAFDVGSGGYSGGFTSWNQIGVVFSNLMGHSDFGGTSYGPNQTSNFQNKEQAFNVGYNYLQRFGYNGYLGADASQGDHNINLLEKDLVTKDYENGLLRIIYGKFLNDINNQGVQIGVYYIGSDLMSNAHWEQLITTNDPRSDGSEITGDIYGMFSYFDTGRSHDKRKYYPDNEMKMHISGTSVYFIDGPNRPGFTFTSWSGELILYNNSAPILRVNYGYTLDTSGCHPIPYTYYIYH